MSFASGYIHWYIELLQDMIDIIIDENYLFITNLIMKDGNIYIHYHINNGNGNVIIITINNNNIIIINSNNNNNNSSFCCHMKFLMIKDEKINQCWPRGTWRRKQTER